MTYQELFTSSLALLAEDSQDTDGIADYAERAPYLLATFLTTCSALDNQYRLSHGREELPPFEGVCVAMDADFLLSAVLAPAAVYYLSSMLVLEENEALSDKLFATYSDLLSQIADALPGRLERIVNKYPRA